MLEFNEDGSLKLPENVNKVRIKKKNIEDRSFKTADQLKNSFFREFVFKTYNYKCHKCGTIDNLRIHHYRYNWKCTYEEKDKLPDCEKCYNDCDNENSENYKKFWECLSCVELLCENCHTNKHKQLQDSTGDWVGHSTTKRTEDGILRCKYCDYSIEEDMLYCPNCSIKLKLSKEEAKKKRGGSIGGLK